MSRCRSRRNEKRDEIFQANMAISLAEAEKLAKEDGTDVWGFVSRRVQDVLPQIDFMDDREGCLFTATVHRTAMEGTEIGSVKSSVKTDEQILRHLSEKTDMTIPVLAKTLGLSTRAVEKQIAKLKKSGRLRRVGSRKAGRWEVPGVDE